VILAYAAAFRVAAMNRPFHYDDEATGGSFYGLIARNYLRFPWRETHGIPVVTVGRLPGVPLVFYADHSPLVPLLIAPVYAAFGVGEWQTRLPTSIATLMCVAALFALMRRFGADRAAVAAAAVFAATPMVLHFGGQPEVLGMPLVLFAVLTIAAYLSFCARLSLRAFALLVGAFTLAAVSDWPAFVLVPLLAAHFAATRPRCQWRWMIAFGVIACVVFALLNIYIAAAASLPWNWIVPLFIARSVAIGAARTFSTRSWLQMAWTFNLHLHTLPVLVAAVTWIALRGLRFSVPQRGATAARLLLAWGILHVVIARQGVFNHEWWWWPLTPGLAAATGLLLDWVLDLLERRELVRLPRLCAAAAIALFAAWTAAREYRALFPAHRDGPFTTVELGQAIRAAAPAPNDLAMLAWSGDDPELWFYGDRPLRADIWSVDDFIRRSSDPYADLVFGDLQPWPAPPAGLVFPAICRQTLPELYGLLAAKYPRVPLPAGLGNKFDVFALDGRETPPSR